MFAKTPREIPPTQDPTKTYPEKAPGAEPGNDNPRNPQDDESTGTNP